MFVALRAHLDAIADDDTVRCVVLAGAGRSFCAGHDLGSIADNERAPSKHFEPETVDALEALPQPAIARIHGHCFTGGLELALPARTGLSNGSWPIAAKAPEVRRCCTSGPSPMGCPRTPPNECAPAAAECARATVRTGVTAGTIVCAASSSPTKGTRRVDPATAPHS